VFGNGSSNGFDSRSSAEYRLDDLGPDFRLIAWIVLGHGRGLRGAVVAAQVSGVAVSVTAARWPFAGITSVQFFSALITYGAEAAAMIVAAPALSRAPRGCACPVRGHRW
jgi:hypothetical protein